MKGILLIGAVISVSPLLAQVSTSQVAGAFSETAKLGRLQGGESLLQFSSNNAKGTKYLYDDWKPGTVTTTNNVTETDYDLVFDKENNDVYARKKNTHQVLLLFKDQIKAFNLNNQRFVVGNQIEGADPTLFYQLLASSANSPVLLYKAVKTKFVKADKHDAERIKRGDFEDEYQDEISYYIKLPDQPLHKINLSERSLLKALPEKADAIKTYFRTHSDDVDQQYVINLVNAL